MTFHYFINAVPARVRSTPRERVIGILIALAAMAIASGHRVAGFAAPYHVWFRQYEKSRFGDWAPSSIEHLVGGFGFVALWSLAFSCHVAPIVRNRLALSVVFGVIYFVGSTYGWTHLHYVQTGDPAKLVEMVADVIAIFGAVLWVSWPKSNRKAKPAGEQN